MESRLLHIRATLILLRSYLSYPLHTPVSLNSTLSVHSCPFTDPLHHLPALIYCTPSNHPPCPHLLLQTTLPALIYSFIPPSLLLFTPSYYPHPKFAPSNILPALIYSFILPSLPSFTSSYYSACSHLLLHITFSGFICSFIPLLLPSFTVLLHTHAVFMHSFIIAALYLLLYNTQS